MEADAFDLAGFCVGVVERDRVIDGATVRAGDAVIGLAASGLHANGFSLVRSLVAEYALDLRASYQERLLRTLGERVTAEVLAREPEHALATLGEVLLAPTRIYARTILDLRTTLEAAGHELRAVAHVTGGGLPGNVPRVLPKGLGARLDPSTWPMPSVMRLFGALGGLEEDELRATFNGGLGMVVVVGPAALGAALLALSVAGVPAWRVGEVVATEEVEGRRYSEGPLAR
jgi:phosphoribosylformylglycinamidine cyclo-ligase